MIKISPWIEAMRLRTIPVSVAGVLMAIAFNIHYDNFRPLEAALCLVFAILAQIASNFANELFDYTEGRDRPGREGPRRGVTEGDITPRGMKAAITVSLAVAGAVGIAIASLSSLWLIPVGIIIALGVFAYSAGPYPLSTHALGELAVIVFFGIIPVNLTYFVQSLTFNFNVALASLSIGLMGANVLIINNYRDIDDDRTVGKITLAVRLGARAMPPLYITNAVGAAILLFVAWRSVGWPIVLLTGIYTFASAIIALQMTRRHGHTLTPLLGATAMLMAAISLAAFFL